MDVEVEVKGTSEYAARHLEPGLLGGTLGQFLVFTQRNLADTIVSTMSKFQSDATKRDAQPIFRFLCPEVILGEKGRHRELDDPLSSALQKAATKVESDLFSKRYRTLPIKTG